MLASPDKTSMASGTYPTNEDGSPVCARPTPDGACLHEVSVPGAPCVDHRGHSPVEAEEVVWRPRDPEWTL